MRLEDKLRAAQGEPPKTPPAIVVGKTYWLTYSDYYDYGQTKCIRAIFNGVDAIKQFWSDPQGNLPPGPISVIKVEPYGEESD